MDSDNFRPGFLERDFSAWIFSASQSLPNNPWPIFSTFAYICWFRLVCLSLVWPVSMAKGHSSGPNLSGQ